MLTKQETLLEEGSRAESSRWGGGNTGDPLCCVAPSLGFYGAGLVSGLSLANHSDSESFLVAHTPLNQDGCQREGF